MSTMTLIISALVFQSQTAFAVEKQVEQQPVKKEEQIDVKAVQRFSDALNQIKNYYVTNVTDKKLFENAIRGMLAGLDPHSAYLDENEFQELQDTARGEFGGVGLEVTMEEGVVKVITAMDDTPAKKAGLKSNDYIVRIDQTPVKGLSLQDAVSKMRGEKGSIINFVVLRKGETKPLKFSLKRDVIEVKSVKSRLIDKNYGYVRISHFQTFTARDLTKAVVNLKKQAGGQLKGLILDLRNNPGGLLESAIQTSDAFIDATSNGKEELIVYTKGRLPGSKFTAVATHTDILNHAPIVVLINEGSASASEIVAGALKDNKRAILVGTRTFGKGSVQTVLPIDDKSAIKLTTALYYTPSGRSIQAQGIEPDIIVNEMKISKKSEASPLENINEADLVGHLNNGQQTNEKNPVEKKTEQNSEFPIETQSGKEQKEPTAAGAKSISASNKEEEEAFQNDYQLVQAINVLKGLVVSHNNN